MASKATRRQLAVCAIVEGYAKMMQDQGAGDDEQFSGIRQRIGERFEKCARIIENEPGAALGKKDIDRIGKALDILHAEQYDGPTDAAKAVSMMLCMLSDLTVRTKREAKRQALSALLEEVENLMVWCDPACEYQLPDGYNAAMLFDRLEV